VNTPEAGDGANRRALGNLPRHDGVSRGNSVLYGGFPGRAGVLTRPAGCSEFWDTTSCRKPPAVARAAPLTLTVLPRPARCSETRHGRVLGCHQLSQGQLHSLPSRETAHHSASRRRRVVAAVSMRRPRRLCPQNTTHARTWQYKSNTDFQQGFNAVLARVLARLVLRG
jgi:hypothetical protein